MASPNSIDRFLVVFIFFGVGFSGTALCEVTEVYQQGNSTTVIKQTGNDNAKETKITRTPQGQKIITRSGNNTDISTQSSGNAGRRDSGASADSPAIKSTVDSDRFTRGARELPDCTTDKSCDRGGYDAPTEDEFKDRILRRMRPLSTDR